MKQQRRLQNYFSDGKFSAAIAVKPPGLSHKMMKNKRKERWKRERQEGGLIERIVGGGIERIKPIWVINEERTCVCVRVSDRERR